MANNKQSRKWQITINNPIEKSFSHEQIKESLGKLKSAVYWCMSDEHGMEEETLHTHICLVCSSPVRFSTMQNLFHSAAHLEAAKGTSQQNRDDIAKDGRWSADEKHGTKIEGSFEERGEIPEENKIFSVEGEIISRIQDGATNAEILLDFPHYLRDLRDVEYVRQTLRAEEYRGKWRKLEVTYIFGITGIGKTRFVLDGCGYSRVYQVNNYKRPFDGCNGENVILFDEFTSSFRIQDMSNYLDCYPLTLPARYNKKQACYEIAFIISNLDLREQYHSEQIYQRSIGDVFIRRIHKVIHFMQDAPYNYLQSFSKRD